MQFQLSVPSPARLAVASFSLWKQEWSLESLQLSGSRFPELLNNSVGPQNIVPSGKKRSPIKAYTFTEVQNSEFLSYRNYLSVTVLLQHQPELLQKKYQKICKTFYMVSSSIPNITAGQYLQLRTVTTKKTSVILQLHLSY